MATTAVRTPICSVHEGVNRNSKPVLRKRSKSGSIAVVSTVTSTQPRASTEVAGTSSSGLELDPQPPRGQQGARFEVPLAPLGEAERGPEGAAALRLGRPHSDVPVDS